MGSYCLMDDKGNGVIHAGTRIVFETVSVVLPEPAPDRFPVNVLRVASYKELVDSLKREKVRADTGHFPECSPLYPGGFCDC